MDIEQEELRAHNLVTAYKDWENQKDMIGTVLLIKKLESCKLEHREREE